MAVGRTSHTFCKPIFTGSLCPYSIFARLAKERSGNGISLCYGAGLATIVITAATGRGIATGIVLPIHMSGAIILERGRRGFTGITTCAASEILFDELASKLPIGQPVAVRLFHECASYTHLYSLGGLCCLYEFRQIAEHYLFK